MKFSTKIILSFIGVTLLLLAIGLTSQYLNNQVRKQVVQESQEAVQELQFSGDMGFNLYKSLINTQYYLEDRYRKSINDNDEEVDLNTKKAQERVEEALQNLKSSIVSYREMSLTSGENGILIDETPKVPDESLQSLQTKFEIYSSLVRELLKLTRQDYDDGKEFFTVTIEPYFRDNLLPLVDELRDHSQVNLDNEINSLNAQLSQASKLLFFATIAAFLLSLVLAYFLYRSVAYPLNDLAAAVQNIGSGNLDQRIEIKRKDEVGHLADEFNRMAENLSKTTVSRNFMDDIIESMADSLVVTDAAGVIQRVNSSTVTMLGYREEELVGKSLSKLFASSEKIARHLKNGREIQHSEATYQKRNGDKIPVSLSLASIHNSNGEERGMVCLASDISQRKKAEEQITNSLKEKEILLAEIHHRVKNNLAVISGLLQMQIWETEDEAAETALKDSQLRVQSIALVHEKLYQSESLSFIQFDRYIRDLLQAISSTYMDSHGAIEIKTELEEIALNITQAIPCSLLLNELIVNAYKHAFDSLDEGTILVNIYREGDRVHMLVKDNGVGFPDEFELDEANSLGMTLIDTLIQQLQGEITVSNDDGAIFEIHFKAEEVVQD